MRIVITGGHGFIGTALWRELARTGRFGGQPVEQIVLLDRVARPTDPIHPAAGPVVTTLEGIWPTP